MLIMSHHIEEGEYLCGVQVVFCLDIAKGGKEDWGEGVGREGYYRKELWFLQVIDCQSRNTFTI